MSTAPTPTLARKTGRPRRDQRPSLDRKALVARLLLIDEEPVNAIRLLTGHSSETVYRWVREVCGSDHELAPILRPLAARRGLLAGSD